MKNTVIRFGLYAAMMVVGVSFLFWAISSDVPNYTVSEIVGYVSIVLAMIFVFLGIRQYRENEKSGVITFGEALKLGVMITLIPSLAFGIYNAVYTEILDPGFIDSYYQYTLEEMKADMPADEFEAAAQKMEAEKEMFANPVVGSVVMFLTVFLIGFVIAVISAFILKKEAKAAPERA